MLRLCMLVLGLLLQPGAVPDQGAGCPTCATAARNSSTGVQGATATSAPTLPAVPAPAEAGIASRVCWPTLLLGLI